MMKLERDPKNVALQLLSATILPDGQVFPDLDAPRYTTVDYYRMACHMIFQCQRCGNGCTTGDPIRLRSEDVAAIAKSLKIPLNKALKKYTIQDPEKAGVLDFKHILPCKFYDSSAKGCKIYAAGEFSGIQTSLGIGINAHHIRQADAAQLADLKGRAVYYPCHNSHSLIWMGGCG